MTETVILLTMSLVSWPPSTTLPNKSLQTTKTTNGGRGLLLQATAASCMTSYVFYLFLLCKINSLLCFSLFRIIFCPRGTRQTSCHRLSSHMILMCPCHYLRLSFLQVPLIRTSCLLTLALLSPAFIECHQFQMKHPFLANPSAIMCLVLTKSPRSKSSNRPESFPTQFLWGQCVFLLCYLDFLTYYYFSFSLVNVVAC